MEHVYIAKRNRYDVVWANRFYVSHETPQNVEICVGLKPGDFDFIRVKKAALEQGYYHRTRKVAIATTKERAEQRFYEEERDRRVQRWQREEDKRRREQEQEYEEQRRQVDQSWDDFFDTLDRTVDRLSNRPAFQFFGLAPGCTREELQRAFRDKALAAHPDHGGSAAQFQQVNAMFQQALEKVRC